MTTAPNMSIDIGGMRQPYNNPSSTFDIADLNSKEPFGQFFAWFQEAKTCDQIEEPNAMALATASKSGLPSVRMLLLKEFGKDSGFVFYTNYGSRKGQELQENPNASIMFYWEPMKRSVRIEGTVSKISRKKAEAYFHSRPFGSQIGAMISNQSSVIPNRQYLEEKEQKLQEKYKGAKEVPLPDNWGGFQLIPSTFEFWQGQSTRIHDRLRFRKLTDLSDDEKQAEMFVSGDEGWIIERLSP